MENILLWYSLSFLILLANTICYYKLQDSPNESCAGCLSFIPPIGILLCIIYRRQLNANIKVGKKWRRGHPKLDDEEIDYIVANASEKELELLMSIPKTVGENDKIKLLKRIFKKQKKAKEKQISLNTLLNGENI